MTNLLALFQAQAATRPLFLRFVGGPIILLGFLMIPGIGFDLKSFTKTGWFFIGVPVLLYGTLILGSGIYDPIAKPIQSVVFADLHAGIWWGSLMLILGGIHTYRYSPRKEGL